MNRKYLFYVLLAIALLLSSVAVAHEIPCLVYYEGNLTDASGNPLEGKYEMVFSIWKNVSSNLPEDKLWEEYHPAVPVNNGLFNVILGSVNSISLPVFSAEAQYLEIIINKETLSPRQQILGTAFTYTSSRSGTSSPAKKLAVTGTVDSKAGGIKSPDGTNETAPLAGPTTGNTLDQAYDQGGRGRGRIIYADAGAVNIMGPDGLLVNGKVGIGLSSPGGHQLKVKSSGIGTWGSTVSIENDHQDGISLTVSNRSNEAKDLALLVAQHGTGDIFRCDSWTGGCHPVFKVQNEGKLVCGGIHSHSTGTGVLGGTAHFINDNPKGIGMSVESTSEDLTLLLGQHGSGDIFRCDSWTEGWKSVFKVKNNGKLECREIYSHSTGTGVLGGTTQFINDNPEGIGMSVKSTSEDLTLLLSQHGTGDILRCDSWIDTWKPVFKVENDGKTTCSVLQITGGSDLAEPFDIVEPQSIEPGMVVVIDPENPEKLKISDKAYDRCVAGIVSGAGGIKPGIAMVQEKAFEGDHQVALTGRVYGLCDASYGTIEPGDLLTTSPNPGYAMKVTDNEQAQGAILGKAMTKLEQGQGLVLVLVSLQ